MPTYDYGNWFQDVVDCANKFGCSTEEAFEKIRQMANAMNNTMRCSSHAEGYSSTAMGSYARAYGINNVCCKVSEEENKDIALMGGWIEEDDNAD